VSLGPILPNRVLPPHISFLTKCIILFSIDQGPTPSWDSRLAGQGSRGLGLTVRLVGVQGGQCHLRVEPAKLVEQAISSSLWRGRTRLQDPEDGMILVLLFRKFCILICL
jgi:hypothetical protein